MLDLRRWPVEFGFARPNSIRIRFQSVVVMLSARPDSCWLTQYEEERDAGASLGVRGWSARSRYVDCTHINDGNGLGGYWVKESFWATATRFTVLAMWIRKAKTETPWETAKEQK